MHSDCELHRGETLGELFRRCALRFAGRPALVSDGQSLSYAALAARVARMGAVLRRHGLRPGSAVAIRAGNRADVLVLYLTCLVEGFRLTPLAPMASLDDQAFILADAEIGTLVLASEFAGDIAALTETAPGLSHIFTLGGGGRDLSALTDAEPEAPLRPQPNDGAPATIFYTGGTTGRPKGVVHTHDSIMASILMATAEWDWPQEIRTLVTTPVSHAGGAFAWPAFLKGGSLHLLPAFAPDSFAQYVARESITVSFMVPTMIYRLLDDPHLDLAKLSSLETIVYGAAPIAPARLAEAVRRFGPIFMQLYGQTEAPNCIAYLGKSQHDPDDLQSLSSCGVPLGAVQVRLLNEQCAEAAPGEAGEICVRGALVMTEYWRRPEETASALEGGWLHTGDIGRFDAAGRLHIVDRKKDMIITGGFNVFPSEIEAILSADPSVSSCAVIGIPDEAWGEAVTAVVVARNRAPIDTEALRAMVRERKGPVHTPKRIVVSDNLPLTPAGKIDKKALRAALS